MRSFLRGSKKSPPPREPKKKKSLNEAASEMLQTIKSKEAESERAKIMHDWKEQQKTAEDEVAEMTYGPNWRELVYGVQTKNDELDAPEWRNWLTRLNSHDHFPDEYRGCDGIGRRR